ncbi:MAG: DUF2807 domain-containing protein [Bacteroidetes bacterium]|nr:DUF2807 domain-containing protein [Bacteroidota bacterium]
MKSIIKLTFATALLLGSIAESHAQWGNKKVVGNGNITTRTVNTGNYDAIKGVGSMDIHLEKGSEGTITVKTDDNLQEYIIVEVKDNSLIVRTKKNMYLKTKKGIHVTVPFNDISKVSLTGSGDVDSKDTIRATSMDVSLTGSGDIVLDIDSSNLESTVTGSGDIELSGSTENLEVTVTGSGDFSGANLLSNNTEVRVSGSGDASVYAKESLKARVSGSGDIDYRGNPDRKDTKVSGSGDISSY